MLDILRVYWPKFNWALFHWLSHAKLVTLTLLVVAAVLMLASGRRYRRRMVTGALAVLLGYWFVISPLFSVPATYLLTRSVPPDTGETADAIVVLARQNEIQGDRYETAIDMVASGRATQLVIMGKPQGKLVFRSMLERHISPEGLSSAVCVRTTNHEAYSTGAILGPRGADKIVLITDPPHMLRAWLLFKSLGFSVVPHMEPISPRFASHERSILAIREVFGIMSYTLLGRFESRPASALPQLAQEVAESFPPDRCVMTADQIRQELSSS